MRIASFVLLGTVLAEKGLQNPSVIQLGSGNGPVFGSEQNGPNGDSSSLLPSSDQLGSELSGSNHNNFGSRNKALAALLEKRRPPPPDVIEETVEQKLPPNVVQVENVPPSRETDAGDQVSLHSSTGKQSGPNIDPSPVSFVSSGTETDGQKELLTEQAEKEKVEKKLIDDALKGSFLKALNKNTRFKKSREIVDNGRKASALVTDLELANIAGEVWNKNHLSEPKALRDRVVNLLSTRIEKSTEVVDEAEEKPAKIEITTDVVDEMARDIERRIAAMVRADTETKLRAAQDKMITRLKELNLKTETQIASYLNLINSPLVGSARLLSEKVQAAFSAVMKVVRNEVMVNEDADVDIHAKFIDAGFGDNFANVMSLADVKKAVSADILRVKTLVKPRIPKDSSKAATADAIKNLFIDQYRMDGYSRDSVEKSSRPNLFELPTDSQPTNAVARGPVHTNIFAAVKARATKMGLDVKKEQETLDISADIIDPQDTKVVVVSSSVVEDQSEGSEMDSIVPRSGGNISPIGESNQANQEEQPMRSTNDRASLLAAIQENSQRVSRKTNSVMVTPPGSRESLQAALLQRMNSVKRVESNSGSGDTAGEKRVT